MQLSLIVSGSRIKPGQQISHENIVSEELLSNRLILRDGQLLDTIIKFPVVQIRAESYSLGWRVYNLMPGFCLLGRVTDKGDIIPELRLAMGKERLVGAQEGKPNLYWPTIIKCEDIVSSKIEIEEEEEDEDPENWNFQED